MPRLQGFPSAARLRLRSKKKSQIPKPPRTRSPAEAPTAAPTVKTRSVDGIAWAFGLLVGLCGVLVLVIMGCELGSRDGLNVDAKVTWDEGSVVYVSCVVVVVVVFVEVDGDATAVVGITPMVVTAVADSMYASSGYRSQTVVGESIPAGSIKMARS